MGRVSKSTFQSASLEINELKIFNVQVHLMRKDSGVLSEAIEL